MFEGTKIWRNTSTDHGIEFDRNPRVSFKLVPAHAASHSLYLGRNFIIQQQFIFFKVVGTGRFATPIRNACFSHEFVDMLHLLQVLESLPKTCNALQHCK